MAELLSGVAAANTMCDVIAKDAALLKSRGVQPKLAIVRVGDKPDDAAYERGAQKRCQKLGIAVKSCVLDAHVAQETLLALINSLNIDSSVHGVLLLRPLPKYIDDFAVRNALAPEKDVDGITDSSLAKVFSGEGVGFAPCTAQACVDILEHYGVQLEGKNVVIIGRSIIVGKPAAMLFLQRNATVTVCHTRTRDLQSVCRNADVLVAAVGRAGLIDGRLLSPGQVVVDVGINVDADGMLCGDVNFAQAESIVSAITPVPGGVGSVTTTVLCAHVVQAASRAAAL